MTQLTATRARLYCTLYFVFHVFVFLTPSHCLSCQFDSPTAGSLPVERVRCLSYDARSFAQNAAHISSDKQLVEIYEIELIMSLRFRECQRDPEKPRTGSGTRDQVACQRVFQPNVACLPFSFSMASSCRTMREVIWGGLRGCSGFKLMFYKLHWLWEMHKSA